MIAISRSQRHSSKTSQCSTHKQKNDNEAIANKQRFVRHHRLASRCELQTEHQTDNYKTQSRSTKPSSDGTLLTLSSYSLSSSRAIYENIETKRQETKHPQHNTLR